MIWELYAPEGSSGVLFSVHRTMPLVTLLDE